MAQGTGQYFLLTIVDAGAVEVPNDPMILMSPLQVGHWTHWTLLHFRRFGGENGPIHGIHESTSFSPPAR